MVFDGPLPFFVFSVLRNVAVVSPNFRSKWLTLLAAALVASLLKTTDLPASDTYLLSSRRNEGDLQRVQVVIEVSGKVKLNADGRKISKLPVRVKGELVYQERILEVKTDQRTHARYYDQAKAVIQVGKTRHQATLPEDRRLLVSQADNHKVTLFSPLGPLSRDALELVDVQGSSAVVERLLPGKAVAIGDSWSHADTTLATLLGLDVILQNDAQSTLRTVEGPVAIIKLKGSVRGTVGGVSTDVELNAVYNFDQDLGQVNWLAMSVKERRAIGHAEPGIDATARVRVGLTPLDEAPRLTDESLAGYPLEYQPGAGLLDFRSHDGGFRFLHARGWQVMIDRHDVAILRLIERGDLIAQCNASNLSQLKPGTQPQLAAFQTDVKRALGDKFGQFIEASQSQTKNGLKVLRAVVSGTVSELPIQWTYYHISSSSGRQVALVFTLESKLVERFAEADQVLVSSFEFLDSPAPTVARTAGPHSARVK